MMSTISRSGVRGLLQNERGSLLVYALFLIMLISVITIPFMQMSSTRALADERDKNQKIATNLAVSATEEYLRYLTSCGTPCTDQSRFRSNYFIGGLSNTPQMMSITLADGTAVTYMMHYQALGNDVFNIVTRVVAGDTNRDNIADEKFAAYKEIVYQIDASIKYVKLINPDNPQQIERTDKIYLDTTTGGDANKITNPQRVTELKQELTTYLHSQTSTITNQIDLYIAAAVACSSTTCINDQINKATTEPVVIHLGSTRISSYDNRSGKKVVLLFDTIDGNFTGSNVDIVVNRLNMDSRFTLTNGSLWITDNINMKNNSNISIANGTLFTNNFVPDKDNSISITADRFIVANSFVIKNTANLNIANEVVLGNIEVKNNANLTSASGDFFVTDNFSVGNNTSITAGGSVAIGGAVDIGSISKLQVGGGTTILNPSGTSEGTPSSGEIIWSPTRQ